MALTSLNKVEYDFLLGIFDSIVTERLTYYTLKGCKRVLKSYNESSNSSLYGSRSKLDFLLMYLKENPNQAHHACLFEMCQSKVSEWIKFLFPVLEACLIQLDCMPASGSTFKPSAELQTDYLIADVSERPIPRRRCRQAQQQEYSGKKKHHTIKNLAIIDSNKMVLYLSETYEGSVHDKSILDDVQIHTQGLTLLLDLGFQGADKDHQTAILPYKKSKNKELTDLQKSINKAISKERVLIENVFSSIKRLKIVRNKVRLKSSKARHLVFRIAAGIHNLRNMFRNPIINYS